MSNDMITIVSPHQDDAAFSLGNFIMGQNTMHVNIVNCFTISEYCPHIQNMDREGTIKIRSEEDQKFCSYKQGKSINVVNLHELDGPIRLNTKNLDDLFTNKSIGYSDILHLSDLCRKLSKYLKGTLFLPIGIGGHIDHVLSHLAGIFLTNDYSRIIFYLDVPYWIRMPHDEVRMEIQMLESNLNIDLVPFFCNSKNVWDKKILSQIYSSQITEKEIREIISAPFQGEIFFPVTSSNVNRFSLKEIAWTDLNL